MKLTKNERENALSKLYFERGAREPENPSPTQLPLKSVRVLQEVFQPRYRMVDFHVGRLASAIASQDGKPLEPITVWWSGRYWYVIDGHHRLEAYKKYNQKHPLNSITSIPVMAFTGSISEAIMQAVGANSRDKLSMSQQEKSDAAWRLVAMDDKNAKKSHIAQAAGITRQTVHHMFRVLKVLKAKSPRIRPLDLSWTQARLEAKNMPTPSWDDDRKSELAIKYSERLYRHFGDKLIRNPEVTALALEMYSENLVRQLIETGPFETALEDSEWTREGEEEDGF